MVRGTRHPLARGRPHHNSQRLRSPLRFRVAQCGTAEEGADPMDVCLLHPYAVVQTPNPLKPRIKQPSGDGWCGRSTRRWMNRQGGFS